MTRTPDTASAGSRSRPRGHWPIWSRPPLLWVRLGYLTLMNAAFTALYRSVRSHYRLWHWLSQHSSARAESLGHMNALPHVRAREEERACVHAVPGRQRLRVPDPGARRLPGDDEGELRPALPIRGTLPAGADPDRGHRRRRVSRLLRHPVQLAPEGIVPEEQEHGYLRLLWGELVRNLRAAGYHTLRGTFVEHANVASSSYADRLGRPAHGVEFYARDVA